MYAELREHIAGACLVLRPSVRVKDQIEASEVKPLIDYRATRACSGWSRMGIRC